MFLWSDDQKASFNDDQEKGISESNLEEKGDKVGDKKLLTVLLLARKRRRGISCMCELLQLAD